MRDDEKLEQAIKEVLAFGRRRPGGLGWAIWMACRVRALLVLPVLLTFYAVFKMVQVIAVAGYALFALVFLGGLLFIFLMAFGKFAMWAVQ